MKSKIVFVKQMVDEEYNPEAVFFVAYVDWYGRGSREYSLKTLPKYVKQFMRTHTCEQFSRDGDRPQTFIYR